MYSLFINRFTIKQETVDHSESKLLESKTTSMTLFTKVPICEKKMRQTNSLMQLNQNKSNTHAVPPAIIALRNDQVNSVSLSSISIKQRFGNDFDDLEEESEFIPTEEESSTLVLHCRASTKLTLDSFTSSDSASVLTDEDSVAKRRKRAKQYFEEKGSILIYKNSKPSTNLTRSAFNESINTFCDPNNNTCENNYKLRKIIIVQSVIRKWLVNNRYKKENINRIMRREKYKSELKCIYDLKMSEIMNKINSGKMCEEYKDAKDLFKDYNEIIFGKNSSGEETKSTLHYLFNLCNKNQLNIDDGINKSEFIVLTCEILNIPISDSDINILYENDHVLLNFESFCNWLFHYLNEPKNDFYTTVYIYIFFNFSFFFFFFFIIYYRLNTILVIYLKRKMSIHM